jgi:hypothetical protein
MDYKIKIKKSKFYNLKNNELENEVMEMVYEYSNDIGIVKILSRGQKAVYLINTLYNQIINGGFAQYFWNFKGEYLIDTLESLKLIGANQTYKCFNKIIKLFEKKKIQFLELREKENLNQITEAYSLFESFESYEKELIINEYEDIEKLIYEYIRSNPDEFVYFC